MADSDVISDETLKRIENCLRKRSPENSQIITAVVERIANLKNSRHEKNESNRICQDEDKTIYSLKNSSIETWLEELLETSSKESLIKQVRGDVPSKIFNGIHLKASITDIAVKSKNRGPDDLVYQESETARLHIPRGFSLFEYQNTDDDTSGKVCIVYANRKLWGETVDEDDFLERKRVPTEDSDLTESKEVTTEKEDSKGENYFLSNKIHTKKIISMEKVNGEAAHFSGRYIQGVFHIVAGSKSVHMIFRNEKDIEEYSGDRYKIAKSVALTVLRNWMSINSEQRWCLAQFLHFSQTTVVCELMQPTYQHVVNFDDLKETKLLILCLTPPPTPTPDTLTALPAGDNLTLFKAFGFHIPPYNVLSLKKFDEHSIEIRHQKNSEGRVNYFEDLDRNTIGMVKFKTSWYIHLRALREQANFRFNKKREEKPLEYYKTRSRNRMTHLQTFLNTPEEDLKTWQAVSDLWMEWVESEVKNKVQKVKSLPTRDSERGSKNTKSLGKESIIMMPVGEEIQ